MKSYTSFGASNSFKAMSDENISKFGSWLKLGLYKRSKTKLSPGLSCLIISAKYLLSHMVEVSHALSFNGLEAIVLLVL